MNSRAIAATIDLFETATLNTTLAVILEQNHIAVRDYRYFPSENPKM